MYELALFAGAGGGLLATKWLLGWRTVCYIEIDGYCVEVIKTRIRDGLLDDAPIWDDARTFNGKPWRGCVDIITAGFPCQPWSQAGKGLGDMDKRNLWSDTVRIIREVRPEWILLENVPRLLVHEYARKIFSDLAESGFDCRWDCIPASAVGAPHIRNRVWIIAHSDANGRRFQVCAQFDSEEVENSPQRDTSGTYIDRLCDKMADANDSRQQIHQQSQQSEILRWTYSVGGSWWKAEPTVGRMANGVAHRVGQLRAIGQGQVPAVVAGVWQLLTYSPHNGH